MSNSSDEVCEDEIETENTIVEDAVARIATIPPWSPDDDPFEHPAAIAAWDTAGEALQYIVFDDHDTFAERDLRQALSDVYLERDADGVRNVMREALERGVAIDPADAVDPDMRATAIK